MNGTSFNSLRLHKPEREKEEDAMTTNTFFDIFTGRNATPTEAMLDYIEFEMFENQKIEPMVDINVLRENSDESRSESANYSKQRIEEEAAILREARASVKSNTASIIDAEKAIATTI